MLILKICLATFLLASILSEPENINGLVEKAVKLNFLKILENLPAFKLIKDSIPFARGLYVTISLINGMTKNDTHKEVMNKLDAISTQLEKITESIESLGSRVVSEASHTNVKTVMEKFIIKYSEITKAEHQFENIVKSYATNETALLQNLVKFLKDQNDAYNEFTLVDYLSVKFIGFHSPVDDLIQFGRKIEYGNFIPKSSTTKLVYDFHINLLKKVLRSFTIQELALEFKFKLSGTRHNEDVISLDNRKQEVKKKLHESLKASVSKLNDADSKGFVDLNTESIKSYVKFKNVLQIFLQKLETVSGRDTCRKTCFAYEKVRVPTDDYKDGCRGELRDCMQKIPSGDSSSNGVYGVAVVTRVYSSNYFLFQSPRVDRIYEGFNYAKTGWYGKGSQSDPDTKALTGFKREYDCDICKCVCDQIDDPLTLRKLYLGKLEAPEGFVVTGVKFDESTEQRAIYLNVQVGKLLPMSFIDPGTIKWIKIPKNATDFATIDYDHRLSLAITDPIKFNSKDQVVTGLQLTHENSVVSLNLFGRSLNFTAGTLSVEESKVIGKSHSHWGFGGKTNVKEGKSRFMDKTNVNIKFKDSHLATDAGQSFVPYFDDAEISFASPAPITSIGFRYLTNDDEYAGFVKLTIDSLDYKAFIDEF